MRLAFGLLLFSLGVTVDHGPKAPGALGFVIQHGQRKVVTHTPPPTRYPLWHGLRPLHV